MKNMGRALWLAIVIFMACLTGCSSTNQPTKTPVIKELVNNDDSTSMVINPQGNGSESQVAKVAVKFTPDQFPATLVKLSMVTKNPSGKDQLFTLYGYPDLDGKPDESKELFKVTDQVVPQSMDGMTVMVNLPSIQVKKGSVWIVVEWQEKPLSDQQGQNSFFLTTDGTMDHPQGNMFYTKNGWMSFAELFDQLTDVVMSLTVAE